MGENKQTRGLSNIAQRFRVARRTEAVAYGCRGFAFECIKYEIRNQNINLFGVIPVFVTELDGHPLLEEFLEMRECKQIICPFYFQPEFLSKKINTRDVLAKNCYLIIMPKVKRILKRIYRFIFLKVCIFGIIFLLISLFLKIYNLIVPCVL